MARNVVKRDGSNTSDDVVKSPPTGGAKLADGTNVAQPALLGGTSGMLDDPNIPTTKIGLDITPAHVTDETGKEAPPVPRRFQVTGGPDHVMYAGLKTRMIPGKIYNEGTVDFDLLRKQGVKIEEITDPPPV
jgi:hypothetical protein